MGAAIHLSELAAREIMDVKLAGKKRQSDKTFDGDEALFLPEEIGFD